MNGKVYLVWNEKWNGFSEYVWLTKEEAEESMMVGDKVVVYAKVDTDSDSGSKGE